MSTIFMRFPEGKKKALTLSYDDGVIQDARLIEIMKKHGLKGTFNLNSGLYAQEGADHPDNMNLYRLTYKQAVDLYTESGMEVAVHGLKHTYLEQLPSCICMKEVLDDRENLEKQFDILIRGMAYPFGTFNDQVVECLKQAGIVYARTVIATEKFDIPEDWLRLNPTCHHNHCKLMDLAQEFVEANNNRSKLFYLWGHSHEFEKDDNWNVIENFANYIGNRDNIWYATNIEIYDYINDYNRLIFSVNGKQVYNPTVSTLFFEKDEKLYMVKSGEHIECE